MKPIIIQYLSPEYEQMCSLRDDVLRKPIGLKLTAEEKAQEAHDMFFGTMQGTEMIGCCILSKIDETTGRLRQMAIKTDYQGQGIGRALLQFAEIQAWANGYQTLILHARKTAMGFYEKEDYEICSDVFMEVGIPHYEMKKNKK